MNGIDTNALRARIMKQYVKGKEEQTLSAAMRMDQRELAANNANVDCFARLAFLWSKMTEEQRDLLMQIMDLTEGRPDRLEFAAAWTGKAKDLPAALAQI